MYILTHHMFLYRHHVTHTVSAFIVPDCSFVAPRTALTRQKVRGVVTATGEQHLTPTSTLPPFRESAVPG